MSIKKIKISLCLANPVALFPNCQITFIDEKTKFTKLCRAACSYRNRTSAMIMFPKRVGIPKWTDKWGQREYVFYFSIVTHQLVKS